MRGFLHLTNLMSQVATFSTDRAEAHHQILDALEAALGKGARGWIGYRSGADWVRTAGTGSLSADPDGASSIRSDGRVFVGRSDTEAGQRVAVQVEAPEGVVVSEAKIAFKVGLDLLAAYEGVREHRLRSLALQQQTQRLIDLAASLGNRLYSDETFYSELLDAALGLIPEADAGTIARLQEGVWRYLVVRGHDSEGLRSLVLPEGALAVYAEAAIVDGLLDSDPGTVPGARDQLAAFSRLPVSTLVATLQVGRGERINLAIDITRASGRRFSGASFEVFRRLSGLVQSFLTSRLQLATADRANRRLTEKLALLAEAHDRGTAQHNRRVVQIAGRLARDLGLSDERVASIQEGALLHDIGKLFLSPDLLNQTSPLSQDDRALVRQHTLWAEKLLDDPYFAVDQKIAVYHHERYDGQGYPKGLRGDEIPLEAQIVSVADAYDALRSPRPYKPGFSRDEALRRMVEGDERMAPGAFNPGILATLFHCAADLEELWALQLVG